jgi:hypothetical protein
MRPKKVEAYRTTKLNLEIRVYEAELRKLLKLPVRKGTIESAIFQNGRLTVIFSSVRNKYFTI